MRLLLLPLVLLAGFPEPALAMHISEGLLPWKVAVFWFVVALPFVAFGLVQIGKRKKLSPTYMPLLGIFGAAVFVFSCLPIPIPGVGATAHPAGTGFSAILLGPLPSVVVAFVSLLLQGVFLAHGGLTTLGANIFSMGVVGPLVAFGLFRLGSRLRLPQGAMLFAAAACADLATYLTTSLQLALAFPDPSGGIPAALLKFASIFAVTQLPLAITEGLLTVLIFNLLAKNSARELHDLGLTPVATEVQP